MALHKLPSITIYLQKVRKADLQGYVYMRANIPGTTRNVPRSLGHKVPVDVWDAENEIVTKKHREAARLNELIRADKLVLQFKFDELYKDGASFDEVLIRECMFPEAADNDFIKFFKAYLTVVKAENSKGYLKSFTTSFNRFTEFAGDKLSYRKIDVEFLESYAAHLRTVRKRSEGLDGDGLSANTVHLRMRHLKEVIDKAVKREHIKYRQIDGYRWPIYEQPDTQYLTPEETDRIWHTVTEGELRDDTPARVAALYFLVECYGGIRFSDWRGFSVEDHLNGRNFKCTATKNGQPVYLPLSKFTQLDKVLRRIQENRLVFEFTSQGTNRKLKSIAQKAGITKEITTHTGRRTFATTLAMLKWSDEAIAQAMAVSVKTARGYIKVLRDHVREEAESKGGI